MTLPRILTFRSSTGPHYFMAILDILMQQTLEASWPPIFALSYMLPPNFNLPENRLWPLLESIETFQAPGNTHSMSSGRSILQTGPRLTFSMYENSFHNYSQDSHCVVFFSSRQLYSFHVFKVERPIPKLKFYLVQISFLSNCLTIRTYINFLIPESHTISAT